MWIKVTYAFNSKQVYVNLGKAWRIKATSQGSTIFFNNHAKTEREITVKETPTELMSLMKLL